MIYVVNFFPVKHETQFNIQDTKKNYKAKIQYSVL